MIFNLATDAADPVLGFTTGWVRALARRAAEVDVVTMRAGRLDLPANVAVHSLGKERGYSEPRRALRFYAIIARLLARGRYDGCFAHMAPLFAAMAYPLLRPRKIPIVLWYTHKATPPTLRLAAQVVDRAFTASADSFRVSSDKVVVTGHGIDTDLFAPAPVAEHDSFTIASVGRIAPVKRLELLLDAVGVLRAGGGVPRLRVRLVGPIAERDRAYADGLRRRAAAAGLADVVELPGPVPPWQVADEYRDADVMVNLTATGGLDKAVLEAMSCGVPVVTSNRAFGPVLDPVQPRLLVPDASPERVSAACRHISALPAGERAELGRRLRAVVVEHHSLDRLTDRLVVELAALRPPA